LAAMAWLNARKAERLRLAVAQIESVANMPAFWRLPCEGDNDV
jgi:hypothetical protein